ncbi:replication protein O [Escherichia coli]|nr:replication protein O [Escherichia coli]
MTGSEMAKAGLREQSRLSGANRNALIAEGIMANTVNRPGFPGECFICELRLPDHRF